MTPKHHPSDAMLVAYGAGSLGEALSLAVAAHLALCPVCRRAVADIDALGGVLLDELPPRPLEDDALARTLARIDAAPDRPAHGHNHGHTDGHATCGGPWPAPLAPYVGPAAETRWQRLAPGVRRISLLPRSRHGGTAQLLRIAPGTTLPHHGHGSLELTLVLSGSFADEFGRYAPGDIAEADAATRHQPIADTDQDCVCLIATDAPLRFTSLVSRLFQPLFGM
ncbi:ChrR family anti-sigma-E factor [Azospirillum halopraeferens]|uniref:ChrR family anti-sigma-E factor n=1 Tax=Azospirillum halopraeferens TaxID=34010 RepID=UPI0003FCDCB9|nr:ChrR family anti-sigma-E factor [Azospirillum halopraeferens]